MCYCWDETILVKTLAPVLITVSLLLVPALLRAQDTGPEGAARSACVFTVADLSEGAAAREFERIISEQLEVELARAGYRIVPKEQWSRLRDERGLEPRDLVEGSRALEVADALEADLAVTGFYRVEEQQVILEIKAYDVVQRAFITGVLRAGRLNLSMYNLIDSAVARMLPQIRFFSSPQDAVEVPLVREVTLLSADEGAEVYLGGQQFVGRIREGRLTLPAMPLRVGSSVTVEKRKQGYYTASQDVRLRSPRVEARLRPLKKVSRWGTAATWSLGQAMGFGLAQRYYLNPDRLFLAAEHYFYLQHDFLPTSAPVFHNDLRLLVGGYPFSPVQAPLRISFSTGLGAILTYFWVPQPAYLDLYWNVVNLTLELNVGQWVFFARQEARYALGLARNLLGRGMVGIGDGGPQYTLGVMRTW